MEHQSIQDSGYAGSDTPERSRQRILEDQANQDCGLYDNGTEEMSVQKRIKDLLIQNCRYPDNVTQERPGQKTDEYSMSTQTSEYSGSRTPEGSTGSHRSIKIYDRSSKRPSRGNNIMSEPGHESLPKLLPPEIVSLPIRALSMSSRAKLSHYLNYRLKLQTFHANRQVTQDWTGLAELTGCFYEDILKLEVQDDPTRAVLDRWDQNTGGATMGELEELLRHMERFDVVEDSEFWAMVESDAKKYKERQSTVASVTVLDTCVGSLHLISRESWGARPAVSVSRLTGPVHHVIIKHTTGSSSTDPRTNQLWVARHQVYQMDDESRMYPDIGYSFMVGEDGRVYEGRGWKVEVVNSGQYNRDSLDVAFLGDFSQRVPNEAAQEAFKALIAYGIQEDHVAADYRLLGHRDVINAASPGEQLYRFIQSWEHYWS